MSDQWMGSLAAQDQYRPLGNDPWTNTMRGTAPAPGQGFEPVQQSPVLYNTKAGPITEADIGGAIDIGMGVSGGGLKTDIVKAPGIKAYHSSPHDFDKFDLAKIGTGEGAQVYGHGLYFAENPAVSGQGGQYWQQFAHRFPERETEMAETLKRFGFDRERAAAEAQKHIDMLQKKFGGSPILGSGGAIDKEIAKRQAEIELYRSGKPVGPRTYEVNIKADPAHMLDWDKPLAQQEAGDKVARLLEKRMIEPRENMSGQNAYGELGTHYDQLFRRPQNLNASQAASVALERAGIPGIKYLDQRSRISSPGQIDLIRQNIAQREALLAKNPGNPTDTKWLAEYQDMLKRATNPTSNYVVFDPSIIDIMKKYGIAGVAPAGMGALAAQDAYRGDR